MYFIMKKKVLIFDIFHHGLGDNDSLRKTSSKRSRQGQPVNLLDSHHLLQRTKRSWIMSTLELEEEDKGPFPKLIGEVFNNKSYDTTIKYLISGPGVDKYPEAGLFSLGDDSRGLVYVHRSIDRETNPSFLKKYMLPLELSTLSFLEEIRVSLGDSVSQPEGRSDQAPVRFDVASTVTGEIVDRPLFFTVKIEDINDNAPKFTQKEFDVTVEENHRRDKPIFQVTASDDDEPDNENSRVAYFLVLQTPRTKEPNFTVESCSGLIRMAGCSHYEYRLNITENKWRDILHLRVEDKDTFT
uniref:Uncharacterized protein n=1 Tax=Sphaerodactylus townsendi TaxID=933632 RepID=A0ACB8F6M5_9SAUR